MISGFTGTGTGWRSPSGASEDRNSTPGTPTVGRPAWRSPAEATEDRNAQLYRDGASIRALAVALRGDRGSQR